MARRVPSRQRAGARDDARAPNVRGGRDAPMHGRDGVDGARRAGTRRHHPDPGVRKRVAVRAPARADIRCARDRDDLDRREGPAAPGARGARGDQLRSDPRMVGRGTGPHRRSRRRPRRRGRRLRHHCAVDQVGRPRWRDRVGRHARPDPRGDEPDRLLSEPVDAADDRDWQPRGPREHEPRPLLPRCPSDHRPRVSRSRRHARRSSTSPPGSISARS